MPIVRSAVAQEAQRVATVHVESWRAAYRDLLPDEALEEITVESRLPWWDHVLAGGFDGFRVFVVEGEDGEIRGIGSVCRSDNDPHVGEVAQLYLIPEAWGSGLADPLMDELENDLRRRQFDAGELHVVPTNDRARRFYERRGWHDTGVEHHDVMWGVEFVTSTYRIEF